MNLAQSPTIPTPCVPINVRLPDLSKWEQTEDQQRVAEKKELISETLADVKEILTYPMCIQQIREFLPEAPPALSDWMYQWTLQRHLTRKRIGKAFYYSLAKGSE